MVFSLREDLALARSLATSNTRLRIPPWGLSIPSEAKKQKNPLNTTQDDLVEAKKHYQEHCAVCHAKDGSGQTDTSASMSPEVPDLRANHIPVVVVNTAKSGFVGRVSIHHCEPKGLNYKIGLYALASHAREL